MPASKPFEPKAGELLRHLLRRRRLDLGLSMIAVAHISGMSRVYYRHLESANVRTRDQTLRKLSTGLQIPLFMLCEARDESVRHLVPQAASGHSYVYRDRLDPAMWRAHVPQRLPDGSYRQRQSPRFSEPGAAARARDGLLRGVDLDRMCEACGVRPTPNRTQYLCLSCRGAGLRYCGVPGHLGARVIPAALAVADGKEAARCLRCENDRQRKWKAQVADRTMIGRSGNPRGPSLLNPEKVLEMRALRKTGQSYAAIARAYGVGAEAARRAITGRTYGWLVEAS